MAHPRLPVPSHHSCHRNVHSLVSPASQARVRVAFSPMSTRLCSLWFAGAVLAFLLGYPAHPTAQSGVNLSGTLTNSLSVAVISNGVVQIDELRRTTTRSEE